MGNYKKCDCCGALKPEEDLEEITITMLKCNDCDLSKAPVLESIAPERPPLKTMNPPKASMPASLAGVSFMPPEN